MVTREMLEERNVEIQVELAEYEKACQHLRGALWENQNVLTAMDEMEEEDGNGISHNEVVAQPDEAPEYPEVSESVVEAPYEEDAAWHEEVIPEVSWVNEEWPDHNEDEVVEEVEDE